MVALAFVLGRCFPLTRVFSKLEIKSVSRHRPRNTPEKRVGTQDRFDVSVPAKVLATGLRWDVKLFAREDARMGI